MQFRRKLFFIMIIFAITISFTLATIDHFRLKEQAIENYQLQMEQIEETVKTSLLSIEKAYFFFDKETASKMEANTYFLLDMYEENPLFSDWNFEYLRDLIGMDIYILDQDNTIIHSSFPNDIGLNFSVCCKKLAKVLDERREAGTFFEDGMDIEQETGEIKKYSYMATSDKKYMIELGYALQNGAIFQEFNFLNVVEELIQNYSQIDKINVLNIGGYSLGNPVNAEKLSKERREAFEQTLNTKQITELKNDSTIYRYVHYISDYDTGTTKYKVLEIIYNEQDLQKLLRENKKIFAFKLIIVFIITLIVSLLISRLVALPMHLAFHDSLTGLKNRAAYKELSPTLISSGKGTAALLMIDLDNFKLVNDNYGHDEGDRLLQLVARTIKNEIADAGTPFRLGGDEFLVILPSTSKEEVEMTAHNLIESLNKHINLDYQQAGIIITVSIGIALTTDEEKDPQQLLKKADTALYISKKRGKSQFYFYHNHND